MSKIRIDRWRDEDNNSIMMKDMSKKDIEEAIHDLETRPIFLGVPKYSKMAIESFRFELNKREQVKEEQVSSRKEVQP